MICAGGELFLCLLLVIRLLLWGRLQVPLALGDRKLLLTCRHDDAGSYP